MMSYNWMSIDRSNKALDLVAYYKSIHPRLSDGRITAVGKVRLYNYAEIKNLWKGLPNEFRGLNKYPLAGA
tara:strand:+ start:627 stop:839 length:213 start_codon:yes stop_codon:yes gene_type:complete